MNDRPSVKHELWTGSLAGVVTYLLTWNLLFAGFAVCAGVIVAWAIDIYLIWVTK